MPDRDCPEVAAAEITSLNKKVAARAMDLLQVLQEKGAVRCSVTIFYDGSGTFRIPLRENYTWIEDQADWLTRDFADQVGSERYQQEGVGADLELDFCSLRLA